MVISGSGGPVLEDETSSRPSPPCETDIVTGHFGPDETSRTIVQLGPNESGEVLRVLDQWVDPGNPVLLLPYPI